MFPSYLKVLLDFSEAVSTEKEENHISRKEIHKKHIAEHERAIFKHDLYTKFKKIKFVFFIYFIGLF